MVDKVIFAIQLCVALSMPCKLFSVVSCKALTISLWKLPKGNHCRLGKGIHCPVGNLELYHIAAQTLDMSADEAVPLFTSHRVAFPLPYRSTLFDFFQTIMNRIFDVQMSAFALLGPSAAFFPLIGGAFRSSSARSPFSSSR